MEAGESGVTIKNRRKPDDSRARDRVAVRAVFAQRAGARGRKRGYYRRTEGLVFVPLRVAVTLGHESPGPAP